MTFAWLSVGLFAFGTTEGADAEVAPASLLAALRWRRGMAAAATAAVAATAVAEAQEPLEALAAESWAVAPRRPCCTPAAFWGWPPTAKAVALVDCAASRAAATHAEGFIDMALVAQGCLASFVVRCALEGHVLLYC